MICVFPMQKCPQQIFKLFQSFVAPKRKFIGPFYEGIPSNNMAFAEGLRSSTANRPFGGCHGWPQDSTLRSATGGVVVQMVSTEAAKLDVCWRVSWFPVFLFWNDAQ